MSIAAYQKQFTANPARFGRVAVLYGGMSAEREISLQSGRAVYKALKAAGVDVIRLDLQARPVAEMSELSAAFVDRVFIALHGGIGEDGSVQAFLNMLNIPYTGSDVAASALAMNKLHSKRVWHALNLPTPDYLSLDAESDASQVMAHFAGPCFVKPVHEGSSLGMSYVTTADELQAAYTAAAEFDRQVMVEQAIIGKEFTVAILNDFALPAIELVTDHRFYDYDAKYRATTTRYRCPSELKQAQRDKLGELALAAYHALGCRGWGRVDFMQDQQGNFHLLEVNTVPGLTDHSLVPMAAKAAGLGFDELVLEILFSSLPQRGEAE